MHMPLLSFSNPRIVLTIGDDGVVVVPFGLQDSTPFFAAANDTYAEQEVLGFLARNPTACITLFADNLAQDYRNDELPPLSFFDRRKVLRRRLRQLFPTSRLTAALQSKNEPRRVMMIGIQKDSLLFLWADRLKDRHPTILLLPVEGALLASRLMKEDAAEGWVLTLSQHRSGGLRQIVTYKNDLIFTRLTPLPSGKNASDFLIRDLKATLDYLSRLGLRNPKELSALLLLPEGTSENKSLRDLSFKSIRALSPADAGKLLALPITPHENDRNADILFAALTASYRKPVLPLRLPETLNAWRSNNLRHWGTRIAYASIVLAGLITLWNAGDLLSLLYRTQREASLLSASNRALEQAKSKATPITISLALKKQAVARQKIFEQFKIVPWHSLNQLSRRFDPTATLVGIDWSHDAEAERIMIILRLNTDAAMQNKADAVKNFHRAALTLADAMPDYTLVGIEPPFHAKPEDTLTSSSSEPEEPVGRITLERRTHD